jgi:hypothetical protein
LSDPCYEWPKFRPRIEAARIADMPDREERRAALDKLPECWRGWVKILVSAAFYHKGKGRGA